MLAIEAVGPLLAHGAGGEEHELPLGVTVVSASLPAIGAAVYGIRMQGDFAGAAERNAVLATLLALLRTIAEDDAPGFRRAAPPDPPDGRTPDRRRLPVGQGDARGH